MKRKIKVFPTILIAITLFFSLSAGASAQAGAGKSVKLAYDFPEGKTLTYTNNNDVVQAMDFNGMGMQVNVNMLLRCSITSAGKDGANLKLNVRVDTMSQVIESPQGNAGGPIDAVKDKSFTMTLSPAGKEIDIKEALAILYTSEAGEANLGQAFIDFFPNLPANAIKPGDTWVSFDSTETKFGVGSQKQVIEYNNKYEGLENIDGIECVKISALLKGTMKQTAQTQGMDLFTSGDFTGTRDLYFAPLEGILVKLVTKTKMNGTIEISGPQNMTAPVIIDLNSTLQLKK